MFASVRDAPSIDYYGISGGFCREILLESDHVLAANSIRVNIPFLGNPSGRVELLDADISVSPCARFKPVWWNISWATAHKLDEH